MIQSQVDFHNLKEMIEDKVQEEEHEKTKIKCNFAENIKEILQHKQSKYKMMLHISSKEKKIIH